MTDKRNKKMNESILDLDMIRDHAKGYGGLEEADALLLIERIEILTAALRRVEYETGDPDTFGCPACGALEGTPHAGCCEVGNALSGVGRADGRQRDAALNALDEIAKLCGCPHWDYSGQIVRDVTHLVAQSALLRVRAEKAEGVLEQARGMIVFNDTPFTDLEKLLLDVAPNLSTMFETERLRAEVRELAESKEMLTDTIGRLVMALEKSEHMSALLGHFFNLAKRLMWPEGEEPTAHNYVTADVSHEDRRYTLTLQAVDGKTPADLLNEKDAQIQEMQKEIDAMRTLFWGTAQP
jgi:hypothetical protein